jgi:hypothetical protein
MEDVEPEALALLRRIAVALEILVESRQTCTNTNTDTDPPVKCARQIAHNGLHCTSDGEIQWP